MNGNLQKNLLYITDTDIFSDFCTASAALAVLPPKRRTETEKISDGLSFSHSLAAGVLISLRLSEIGIETSELDYRRETEGKPFFPSVPDFHFSVSHSGRYAAVAFSDAAVGTDIERLRDNFNDVEKVAKRFFSVSEASYILSLSKDVKKENFFRLWCLKESAVKFSGKGLAVIRFCECFDASRGEKKEYIESDEGRRGYFTEFSFDGYRAAVCSASRDPFHVRTISFSEIGKFVFR